MQEVWLVFREKSIRFGCDFFVKADNVDELQEFPFGIDVADSKFLSPSIFTFIVVQTGGGRC